MYFLFHKMILVVSSAVFVGILRRDPHQYPLGGDQHLVWGREGIEDWISKNSTPKAVDRGHQGPRRGAGHSRLRGRERRAAARAAIKIGDTSEETVSVNETTPEPVEETETAENAEISEKSVNAAEIFFHLS